jgi:serine/threonine protein kinase
MSIFQALSSFAVRSVLGDGSENVVQSLGDRFGDGSQRLARALRHANERAWRALEVALAGESLWNRLDAVEDKAFRQQVRVFLDAMLLPHLTGNNDYRRQCLRDLRDAWRKGLLIGHTVPEELARLAGTFATYGDPKLLLQAEEQALANLAGEVEKAGLTALAWLLRLPVEAGKSLVVVAVRYFFRREVESDPQLARQLVFSHVEGLGRAQEEAFNKLDEALRDHGQRLEQKLDDVVEAVSGLRDSVLDLREELQRQLSALGARMEGQYHALCDQVLQLLEQLRLQGRPVRVGDSFALHGAREHEVISEMARRYAALPEEQRRGSPALLNGLGKLQLAAGDYDRARDSFVGVVELTADGRARAEAHHNAYRVALERGAHEDALAELKQAMTLDPARFAPFPPEEYEPLRILGVGGFGVTFLCRLKLSGGLVAIKAIEAEGLDRDAGTVMREAAALDELQHPAIVRLRHGGYAGPGRTHPYLVMDYFEGENLEEWVRHHGVLPVPVAVEVGRQVADALRAAHGHGILHRDVKPANLLLRSEPGGVSSRSVERVHWQVKLIDFGLALKQDWLTSTLPVQGQTVVACSVAGTLEYAAPEQLGRLPGVRVGPPADVYGFARSLCFALFETAEPTFQDWQKVPPALAELLGHCLARTPDRRPPSFDAVLEQLIQLQAAEGAEAAEEDDLPLLTLASSSNGRPAAAVGTPNGRGSFLDRLKQAEQRVAAEKEETLARQCEALRVRLGEQIERLELVEAYRTVAELLRLSPDDTEVLAVRLYLDEKRVPSPAQVAEEVLLPLLRGFLPQRDLHVLPDIPSNKLANASQACRLPAGERILALVDATVFGSAKNALLFGREGLYYHNDWSSKVAGPDRVPYIEFRQRRFYRESWAEVGLDQGQFFNRSGSQVSSQKVVELLLAVRQALAGN